MGNSTKGLYPERVHIVILQVICILAIGWKVEKMAKVCISTQMKQVRLMVSGNEVNLFLANGHSPMAMCLKASLLMVNRRVRVFGPLILILFMVSTTSISSGNSHSQSCRLLSSSLYSGVQFTSSVCVDSMHLHDIFLA